MKDVAAIALVDVLLAVKLDVVAIVMVVMELALVDALVVMDALDVVENVQLIVQQLAKDLHALLAMVALDVLLAVHHAPHVLDAQDVTVLVVENVMAHAEDLALADVINVQDVVDALVVAITLAHLVVDQDVQAVLEGVRDVVLAVLEDVLLDARRRVTDAMQNVRELVKTLVVQLAHQHALATAQTQCLVVRLM